MITGRVMANQMIAAFLQAEIDSYASTMPIGGTLLMQACSGR